MTRIAVLVFVVLLAPGVRAATAQDQRVEWENADDVGDQDRAAILRLVQRLGIEDPRRVEFTMRVPGLCEFVRVESAVTVDGARRTWREQRLRRQDWPRCEEEARASRLKEGRWVGSRAQVDVRERWRINDAEWFVDVYLGKGVPYADAERIVLAIRHRTLVSRLPASIGPLKLDTSIPALKDDIDRINLEGPGRYEVFTGKGAGEVMGIVVAGDTVELHSIGTWMVRNEPRDRGVTDAGPTEGVALRVPAVC